MIELVLEVLTDDDQTVKAIRIHGVNNERLPLKLFCDFLERVRYMTPDEPVMLATESSGYRPPVEKDKGYVITDRYGGFEVGDIFKGVSDYELRHCRSGEVFKVNREIMGRLFKCVGDFDERWAAPISQENLAMLERIREKFNS